jgi:hypothetical protein
VCSYDLIDKANHIPVFQVTQAPLHPAVPDLKEEEEEEEEEKNRQALSGKNSNSLCKNITFEPTCDMYPYVRFWKKTLNAHDCHRVNPAALLLLRS